MNKIYNNFYVFLLIIPYFVLSEINQILNDFDSSSIIDSSKNLWILDPKSLGNYSKCGQNEIFGGYELFSNNFTMKRSLINIFPHYSLRVQFDFFMIDYWNPYDNVLVKIDDIPVYTIYPFINKNIRLFQMCGSNQPDSYFPIILNVSHFNPGLKISFESNISYPLSYWGLSNLKVYIDICDVNCLTCYRFLPYTCSSCVSNSNLTKGLCLCLEGYYSYIPFYPCLQSPCKQCLKCHSSCKTCKGGNENDCLSCNDNLFITSFGTCEKLCLQPLIIEGNKCNSPCNDQYYYDRTDALYCKVCSKDCEKCFNFDMFSCLSCQDGKFLYENECLTVCPITTYYDLENKKCLKECNSINKVENIISGICVDIICNVKYCKFCNLDDIDECIECLEGFSIYNKNCIVGRLNKSEINVFVDKIYPPLVYKITFSKKRIKFIDKLENNLTNALNLTFFQQNKNINKSFIYEIFQSESNLNMYYLQMKIIGDLPEKTFLNIHLNDSDIDDDYFFSNYNFLINFGIYEDCNKPEEEYYDFETESCQETISLCPKIELNYDDSKEVFLYYVDYDKIPDIISKNLQTQNLILLSISAIKPSDKFSYQIVKNTETEYSILFTFIQSILGRPLLSLILNPYIIPLEIKLNPQYTIKRVSSIILLPTYFLSPLIQEVKEKGEKATSAGDIAFSALVVFNTIVSHGSAYFIRGLMLTEFIYSLCFLNIDYPPNIIDMFKLKNKNKVFNLGFQIYENDKLNLPTPFRVYGLDPYFFNNFSDQIIQIFTLLMIGFLIKFIFDYKKFKYWLMKKNENIYSKVKLFIFIINWNFIIVFIFSKYNRMVFYVFLHLIYYKNTSPNSSKDFILILVFLIIAILFPIHLFYIVYLINNYKKIHPPSPNRLFTPPKKKITSVAILEEEKEESNSVGTDKFDDLEIESLDSIKFENSERRINQIQQIELENNKNNKVAPIDSQISLKPELYQQNTKTELLEDDLPRKNEIFLRYRRPNQLDEEDFIYKMKRKEKLTCKVILRKIWEYIYLPKNMKEYKLKYEILHFQIKTKYFFQRYIILIDIFRHFLYSAFIVLFFQYSVASIALLFIINISFFILLIIYKPFMSKFLLYTMIIKEIFINMALSTALLISILDMKDIAGFADTRVEFGWIMVSSNLGISYFLLISTILRLVLSSKEYISKYISRKKQIYPINKKKIKRLTSLDGLNKNKNKEYEIDLYNNRNSKNRLRKARSEFDIKYKNKKAFFPNQTMIYDKNVYLGFGLDKTNIDVLVRKYKGKTIIPIVPRLPSKNTINIFQEEEHKNNENEEAEKNNININESKNIPEVELIEENKININENKNIGEFQNNPLETLEKDLEDKQKIEETKIIFENLPKTTNLDILMNYNRKRISESYISRFEKKKFYK